MSQPLLLPRLAVKLRANLPDARVSFSDPRCFTLRLTTLGQREVRVQAREERINGSDPLTIVESSIVLRFESLLRSSEFEILQLVAAENQGLRGVSIEANTETRTLRIRASFVAFKGRSNDEAENMLIDVLSLVRFAKLLEDRITRSSAGGDFCLEMHHSQYVSKSGTRHRYVNYARSIFKGSAERLFGEITNVLRNDHGCEVKLADPLDARIRNLGLSHELQFRVPVEIPMAVLSLNNLGLGSTDVTKTNAFLRKLNQLNMKTSFGHFELATDPVTRATRVSFTVWKHLTNDVRLYSLDHALHAIAQAETDARSLKSQANGASVAPASKEDAVTYPQLKAS